MLELGHFRLGLRAFTGGTLRILLTLIGERSQPNSHRALDFGAFLLLGDNRRRLVIFGRLRCGSSVPPAGQRLADRSAQCLRRCGWEDLIFPERSRRVLTAADVLAFHAAQHALVLLMNECGIGVAYERKTGEGTGGRATDFHVAAFRHRRHTARSRSFRRCKTGRSW